MSTQSHGVSDERDAKRSRKDTEETPHVGSEIEETEKGNKENQRTTMKLYLTCEDHEKEELEIFEQKIHSILVDMYKKWTAIFGMKLSYREWISAEYGCLNPRLFLKNILEYKYPDYDWDSITLNEFTDKCHADLSVDIPTYFDCLRYKDPNGSVAEVKYKWCDIFKREFFPAHERKRVVAVEGEKEDDTSREEPFIGDYADVIYEHMRDYGRECCEHPDTYQNHVPFINSSETGKSRCMHEVAKIIFTIPVNIRHWRDAEGGDYPPSDECLVEPFRGSDRGRYGSWLDMFERLLASILITVKEAVEDLGRPFDRSFLRRWNSHLRVGSGKNRKALYEKSAELFKSGKEANRLPELFKDLMDISRTRTPCCLFSLDGVHDLTEEIKEKEPGQSPGLPASKTGRSRLDHLRRAMLSFSDVLFVITSTQVDVIAPTPTIDTYISSSYRYSIDFNKLIPPISEVPFDIYKVSDPTKLHIRWLSNAVVMATWGRPLWVSLVKESHKKFKEVYSKLTHEQVDEMSDEEAERFMRQWGCSDDVAIFYSAGKKLLNISGSGPAIVRYKDASNVLKNAVMDVRINFAYPGQSTSSLRQKQLVFSHMRIFYSLGSDRVTIESGYPSEIILASVAAKQLHRWREGRWVTEVMPELDILSDMFRDRLIDEKELAGASARMLLLRFRDNALVQGMGLDPIAGETYARPVPVPQFIRSMFERTYAQQVLDSSPESRPGDTFKDVFKDAYVNFSHFNRWGSDTDMDSHAAYACFIRGCAIICKKNDGAIDLVIPVYLRKGNSGRLLPENMTAIFVQVKRGVDKMSPNDRRIDPFGIFKGRVEKHVGSNKEHRAHVNIFEGRPRKGNTEFCYFFKDKPDIDYITLYMELGLTDVKEDERVEVRSAGERYPLLNEDDEGASRRQKHREKHDFTIIARGVRGIYDDDAINDRSANEMTNLLQLRPTLYDNYARRKVPSSVRHIASMLPCLEKTTLGASGWFKGDENFEELQRVVPKVPF